MVPPSVQEKFRVWPVTFLIAQELWSLLGILRPIVETLPKDPRNIMKTQQQYEISQTCGGEKYHFGILNGIHKLIRKYTEIHPENFVRTSNKYRLHYPPSKALVKNSGQS